MKLEMLPGFTQYDMGNAFWSNSITQAKFYSACLRRSYCQYLAFGKFMSATFFSTSATMFIFGICMIFGISSKEQVPRIYALWIVAFVAYSQIVGYWSKMYNPRCAVRSNVFSKYWIATNHSITIFVFSSLPYPAARNFVGIFPKTLRQWFALALHTAKSLWAMFFGIGTGMIHAPAS